MGSFWWDGSYFTGLFTRCPKSLEQFYRECYHMNSKGGGYLIFFGGVGGAKARHQRIMR